MKNNLSNEHYILTICILNRIALLFVIFRAHGKFIPYQCDAIYGVRNSKFCVSLTHPLFF